MSRFSFGSSKGALVKNTVMLTILQLSTYLLALIAVPYETRVLGPEGYGLLGVATAVMVYFQLIVDFGFLLSATGDAAKCRDDIHSLSCMLSSITICKIFLAAISAVVLFALCRIIPAWQSKSGLFFLFFVSTVCTSLMPDYMYRGLEKMSAITIRTVIIRSFFTAAIFIFLKSEDDIYVVPLLNIIGNGTAMVAAYWDLHRRFNIRFTGISFGYIIATFKRSSGFFYSRIATTAYTSLNTVILDMITAGGVATGFYTASDKLIVTGRNLITPVTDSLYPYMVRNRDFRLVKKLLLVTTPLIALFCGLVYIWAEPFCKLLLGPEYGPAGQVLRAMLPIGVFTMPSYILGFPMLTAMGIRKYANYSVIFGSVLHIFNLIILYFFGEINMVSLAVLVSIAEGSILAFRIVVIWLHRDRIQPKEEEDDG